MKHFRPLIVSLLKELISTVASGQDWIWRRVWPKAKKPTIGSEKDGVQNRIVSGTDATIRRHPYQVNRPTLSLNLLSVMSATI